MPSKILCVNDYNGDVLRIMSNYRSNAVVSMFIISHNKHYAKARHIQKCCVLDHLLGI